MIHNNGSQLRVKKWYSISIGLLTAIYTILLLHWYSNFKIDTLWSTLILFVLLYIGISISNTLTQIKNDKGKPTFNKITSMTYVLVGIIYLSVLYF